MLTLAVCSGTQVRVLFMGQGRVRVAMDVTVLVLQVVVVRLILREVVGNLIAELAELSILMGM